MYGRLDLIKKLWLLSLIFAAQGDSPPSESSSDGTKAPIIVTRSEWGAKPARGTVLALASDAAKYVIVHHAASDFCYNQAICQARVRSFQNYHMNERKWSDIGYNFLVGEDGNVYEGRGWGKTGAHTIGYNSKSVGICFIGNFDNRVPNPVATEAVKKLISYGVAQGQISDQYILLGHRQASSTVCPGDKLYQLIKTWPHYSESP